MKNIILSITPVVGTFLPGHPDLKHTAQGSANQTSKSQLAVRIQTEAASSASYYLFRKQEGEKSILFAQTVDTVSAF